MLALNWKVAWLKDFQVTMNMCTSRYHVTEIMLKTAINTIQSIIYIKAKAINDQHPFMWFISLFTFLCNCFAIKKEEIFPLKFYIYRCFIVRK